MEAEWRKAGFIVDHGRNSLGDLTLGTAASVRSGDSP
jgi:hypothetical protein